MRTYITYLRVSTKKQGASGLGLEAQRKVVQEFARNDIILAEYVEIESGKKSKRPRLLEAMAHAKKSKATLLIAKLDRLARNVHFITGLLEAKVDFVAADMPHANKMTIQLMAVMAEWEREQTSQRTIAALKAAKARGVKLGGPHLKAAQASSIAAAEANKEVRKIAEECYGDGMTYAEIALELQRRGILTRSNNVVWQPSQVWRILN